MSFASYSPLSLAHWLTVLQQISPPQQLSVLGAGNGTSAVLQWASEQNLENVTLIEAADQLFAQLCARWQTYLPNWQFQQTVMENGQQGNTFYTASNPAESGLTPPSQLHPLWPNLTERYQQSCEPCSIEDWAAEHWQTVGQWVVIGYLCDAAVLSNNAFETINVLQVRLSIEESLPKGLCAPAWEEALSKVGFRIIWRESERHPSLERWLCIRETAQRSKLLTLDVASHNDGSDIVYQQAQQNWLAGNWRELAELDNATLPEHSQRIMLGIFAACGYQQLGEGKAEQRCVDMVRQWGASAVQVKRFLLAGIYNRLGRASTLLGEYDEALAYFRRSLNHVASDNTDVDHYLEQRIASQLESFSQHDIDAVLQRLKKEHRNASK